jgi:hypothetical protein
VQKKKNKFNEPKKDFFEQKWFKILCLFAFYIFLYYPFNGTFQIDEKELINLNVTVKENCKSGGRRNPIKINFITSEYSNRFGIYVGGTYGRHSEIDQSLIQNNKIKIKIHKDNLQKLKFDTEIVPIYFLSDQSGIIFDETEFNQGENNHDRNINIFFGIIFILALWKILTD